MALGPENFSLDSATFYVDAVAVVSGDTVEVDPAVDHTIRARYKIRNEGANLFHYWECCVTVYDVTNKRAVGSRNDHGQGGISDWKDRSIGVGRITKPTAFRIKIWANQDYDALPPPQTSW